MAFADQRKILTTWKVQRSYQMFWQLKNHRKLMTMSLKTRMDNVMQKLPGTTSWWHYLLRCTQGID